LRDLGRGTPNAINERGQVVGYRAVRKGVTHAFLWENGRLIDLGVLSGGKNSMAVALNERGQVVGSSGTRSGWGHAFLWERGRMVDLGVLTGGRWSKATDINERGQVVGQSDGKRKQAYSTVAENWTPGHGVVWQNGAITDIGSVSSTDRNSTALAIDDRGTVLAYSWHTLRSPDGEKYDADYPHAFLWASGEATALRGMRGYPNSVPSDLNEHGQIVGCAVGTDGLYYDQTSGYTPFRWQSGRMIDLGHLDPYDTFGCANSINEQGVVVGDSGWASFVWQNGKLSRLPAIPGNRYTEAYYINERGWIVGISRSQYDATGDHAVLWTHKG
jgi:probable HAF family extracellular repeat protein